MYFNTPVLFLIFNRLETAKQVFSEIRKAQPKQLFIAADGGRTTEEHLICTKIRQSILDMIDWECEVHTNFREGNAGCGKNVSEAITWFFEHVEEGIILEDDCLPIIDFFIFCSELLEIHRENERIYMISGANFLESPKNNYYHLSAYGHIWGWATWKRAWGNYNYSIKHISVNNFTEDLKQYKFDNLQIEHEKRIFELMLGDKIDTWDYQWHICIWINKAFAITPPRNLISNIGFNESGTHTKNHIEGIASRTLSSIPKKRIMGKLSYRDSKDKKLFYETNLFGYKNQKKDNSIWFKIKRIIHSLKHRLKVN
jgi:hypothetical protein